MAGNRRIAVSGDPREAARVRAILANRGATVVEDEKEAGELVLCEGEGFSFRESIARLETSGRSGIRRIWFHAESSDSAVGSPDREGQGDALVL